MHALSLGDVAQSIYQKKIHESASVVHLVNFCGFQPPEIRILLATQERVSDVDLEDVLRRVLIYAFPR